MTFADAWTLALGTAEGLGGLVIFLLVLMVGFCLAFDLTKFRPTRRSKVIKSLDETVGPPLLYLPPDAPRGPADQLAGSVRSAG
jgi:hypothetical protein